MLQNSSTSTVTLIMENPWPLKKQTLKGKIIDSSSYTRKGAAVWVTSGWALWDPYTNYNAVVLPYEPITSGKLLTFSCLLLGTKGRAATKLSEMKLVKHSTWPDRQASC